MIITDRSVANHLSAIKAHRSSKSRSLVNGMRRSRMRTLTKAFVEKISSGDKEGVEASFRVLQAVIMRNAAKNILHKKAASRRISKLALKIKSL